MSPPGRRLLAAALVIPAGLALVMVGIQSSPPHLRPQPDEFVNHDRPRSIDAHNSPAVAVSPTDPDEMAMVDRSDSPRFSCSLYRSFDGGTSWRTVALPRPADAPSCFWPDVAFDGDGDLKVLYTELGGRYNHPTGLWLQRYDGAQPKGAPVIVTDDIAFHPRFTAEGSRVFVTWLRADPAVLDKPLGLPPAANPVVLARSDDDGDTFNEPVVVSEPGRRIVQPEVLVHPGVDVVVGGLDMVDDIDNYEGAHGGQSGPAPEGVWRVVSWRSTDAGRTFGPAAVAGEVVIPRRFVIDLGPAPSFARHPSSGRVYAAWDGGRDDERDVFLAWSDDGGRRWSQPRPVMRRPGAQFLPAVAVSPDGRVDVTFYDRSRDPDDTFAHVVLASSWNGGRSFITTVVSDDPSDTRITSSGFSTVTELGAQLAVVSQPRRAITVWSDTRRATVDNVAQDLAATVVRVEAAGAREWLMVALGAALLLAGGALATGHRKRAGPDT